MKSNKEVSKGVVFNIQKYSIHDGPGIRTTVFLKGILSGATGVRIQNHREKSPRFYCLRINVPFVDDALPFAPVAPAASQRRVP